MRQSIKESTGGDDHCRSLKRPAIAENNATDATVRSIVKPQGCDLSLQDTQIGFVFQFFQLLPTLTVLENVELPLLLAGARNTGRTALERLDWVGLKSRAGALPHQLSGGQQQRVAIARALVHRPSILVADEPTGNLDTASGDAVLKLIRQSAEEFGATVVMATHSAEAAAIAETRIRLRDGHIEAIEQGRNAA